MANPLTPDTLSQHKAVHYQGFKVIKLIIKFKMFKFIGKTPIKTSIYQVLYIKIRKNTPTKSYMNTSIKSIETLKGE